MKIKYIEIAFEGGDILEFTAEKDFLKHRRFIKRYNSELVCTCDPSHLTKEIEDLLYYDKREV